MGKRRAQKPETARRSQRTRKETQKYEAFKKRNAQFEGSEMVDDLEETKEDVATVNQVLEEDIQALNMLSGVYELATCFKLDVENYSCTHTQVLVNEEEVLEIPEKELKVAQAEDREENGLMKVIKTLTADLEKKEEEVAQKDKEVEKLGAEVRKLKIENNQLKQSNLYRKEVVRLENEVEAQEIARRRLESEVERKKNEIMILKEKSSQKAARVSNEIGAMEENFKKQELEALKQTEENKVRTS